jgi:hypothetical protein
MNRYSVVLLAVFFCFPFSTSQAHHSYAGVYDMEAVSHVQGRVVELRLLNPHTSLYLDVINEDGEVEEWVLEGPGILSLQRRGWTEDMFEEGELIKVYGNPSVRGKNMMWLDRVIKEDGSELVDPIVADNEAIEAERRERLLRIQQQNQEQ